MFSPTSDEHRLTRFLFLGWLFTWLSLQISDLPVKLFLKNQLHLGAAEIAFFGLAVGFAWYTKPILGWLSDSVRFLGTHRRHYLLLSSALAAVVWLAIAVVPPTYTTLFVGFLLLNASKTLSSTVLGGVLVDTGRRFGITGKLSSHRSAVTSVVAVISGPLGGYFAGQAFGWAPACSAVFAFALTLCCYFFLPEEKSARAPERSSAATVGALRSLLRAPSLWWGLLMSFLFTLAPGFGTPLLYVQQDQLKFSPTFIGMLAMLSGGTGMLGALVYGRLCRRFPLRPLLVCGTLVSVVATLLYLQFKSPAWAVAIMLITGFTEALANLPVADLMARATPKGSEALGFSLMISASNVAWKFSDVLGSWLYQHQHFHFPSLVLLNAGTTLAMLLVLPLIPRTLTERAA